jgi:hypothetical protein
LRQTKKPMARSAAMTATTPTAIPTVAPVDNPLSFEDDGVPELGVLVADEDALGVLVADAETGNVDTEVALDGLAVDVASRLNVVGCRLAIDAILMSGPLTFFSSLSS